MRNELVNGGKELGVPRVGTNAGAPSASARPEPRRPGAAPPSPRCGRRPGLGSRRPVTRRLYGKRKGRPERNFSSSLFRRFHSSPRILRGPRLCRPHNSAFWDTEFKLIIKKPGTQKELWLPTPPSCPRGAKRKPCFRKGILA